VIGWMLRRRGSDRLKGVLEGGLGAFYLRGEGLVYRRWNVFFFSEGRTRRKCSSPRPACSAQVEGNCEREALHRVRSPLRDFFPSTIHRHKQTLHQTLNTGHHAEHHRSAPHPQQQRRTRVGCTSHASPRYRTVQHFAGEEERSIEVYDEATGSGAHPLMLGGLHAMWLGRGDGEKPVVAIMRNASRVGECITARAVLRDKVLKFPSAILRRTSLSALSPSCAYVRMIHEARLDSVSKTLQKSPKPAARREYSSAASVSVVSPSNQVPARPYRQYRNPPTSQYLTKLARPIGYAVVRLG
jgi:hypothetical protein